MSKNLDLSKLDSFERGNVKRMLKSIESTEDKMTKVKTELDIYISTAEATLNNLSTNLEGYIALVDNILKPYGLSYKDSEDEVSQPITYEGPKELDGNFNFSEIKVPSEKVFKEVDVHNNISLD
jgi:hypothetical protein